jgi:alpha-tubulin suppressor-like RCC1 family protein
VQVEGLSGVVAVAAGRSHSLALTTDGKVWAWGDNASGELGDGTTVGRLQPVQVSNLSDVTAIAAGGRLFSVALKNDGTVTTWGDNNLGQLGDGTHTPRLRPVIVPGLDQVTAISAGHAHVLALTRDRIVFAWGWNGLGQLGDGTQLDRTGPVQVRNVGDVMAISAGSLTHSLALRRDGVVLGWGNNYSGQMGDAALIQRTTAAPVLGLDDIVAISAGSSHNVAVTSGGMVWVWGSNMGGQLNQLTPIEHIRASHPDNWPQNVVMFSAGGNRTAVLTGGGEVLSVGSGDSGQWGDGTISGTVTIYSDGAGDVALVDGPCTWIKTASEWHVARDFPTPQSRDLEYSTHRHRWK